MSSTIRGTANCSISKRDSSTRRIRSVRDLFLFRIRLGNWGFPIRPLRVQAPSNSAAFSMKRRCPISLRSWAWTRSKENVMIEMVHNFNPDQFMWLWAKYVTGFNENYHCTNSIRGHYSRKFSKNNPKFASSSVIVLDEQQLGSYQAVYVCGVSKQGYSRKANYPHNV